MHAMQYEITLPADYDMRIIRDRVASRGRLLDAFPGLGFKAYLVRERGVDSSPVNQYAPFYVWRTAEGMNSFLWGPGFRGLSADFGRPVVQHWLVAGLHRGAAADLTPRIATKHTTALPEGVDPAEAVAEALAEPADLPGLHCAAVAVDPYRWELLRFALWHDDGPDHQRRYQVLHFSRPEFHALATQE